MAEGDKMSDEYRFMDRLEECKSFISGIEGVHEAASREMPSPPAWLIGLPYAYRRASAVLDSGVADMIGAYLRYKFPSMSDLFAERAEEEQIDIRSLLDTIFAGAEAEK